MRFTEATILTVLSTLVRSDALLTNPLKTETVTKTIINPLPYVHETRSHDVATIHFGNILLTFFCLPF